MLAKGKRKKGVFYNSNEWHIGNYRPSFFFASKIIFPKSEITVIPSVQNLGKIEL